MNFTSHFILLLMTQKPFTATLNCTPTLTEGAEEKWCFFLPNFA